MNTKQILKTAMELEQKAYDFYKEQRDSTKDEKLKKMFTFLMEQENKHYELVQKMHEFIENPESVMLDEEAWMFEG